MTDDSCEYVRPLKTFLDDVPVWDAELGTVPFWKSAVYHGAKNLAAMRADSAAANIGAEAAKTASEATPKAPPLVADAVEDQDTDWTRVLEAITNLEARLTAFEQRKQEETAKREFAERALLIAEFVAESDPRALFDALPSAPKQRLLN